MRQHERLGKVRPGRYLSLTRWPCRAGSAVPDHCMVQRKTQKLHRSDHRRFITALLFNRRAWQTHGGSATEGLLSCRLRHDGDSRRRRWRLQRVKPCGVASLARNTRCADRAGRAAGS